MLRLAAAVAVVFGLLATSAGAQSPPVRLAGALRLPGERQLHPRPQARLRDGPDDACSCRSRSPTPACRRSTTGSPRSPSRSPPTRSSRARTSSRCATTSRMISDDHVVPVVRAQPAAPLRPAAAPAAERRLAAALHARAARAQPAGHRRPAAGGGRRRVRRRQRARRRRDRRRGPADPVGYQSFAENETLAYLYAEALRGAGFRVTRPRVGGLRPRDRARAAPRPHRHVARLQRVAARLPGRRAR